MSFKQHIIALIFFPILFVSTSFLVNIRKEMSTGVPYNPNANFSFNLSLTYVLTNLFFPFISV